MNRFVFLILSLCALYGCRQENEELLLRGEEVIQATPKKLLFVGEKKYSIGDSAQIIKLKVSCNVDYSINIAVEADDWIKQAFNGIPKDEGGKLIEVFGSYRTLIVEVEENNTNKERHAEIIISNEAYKLSDTLSIIQSARKDYYTDGKYQKVQEGSRGNTNLIIMGDGFTKKDLMYNGRYKTIMQQAADYFFSIDPYKSYRDYFNVYAVVAESEEEGVGEKGTWKETKNKFGSAFGTGTEIVCNSDLVFEYARKVKELPADKPLTIIVVLNSTKYAGTTYLYSNGNSIALCPMSDEPSPNDFEGLIHHEAGGHGFGFLCDEYVYYQTTMPESRKQDIRKWQKLGYQMNLDFTNDPSAILWESFLGMKKYSKVGAYEGGYEYQYGVWRSEENSCMNNNIPYFNVQSRWSIVRRIMELSGKEFSISDFIENDNFIYPESTETRSVKEFIPLGSPKWNME